MFNLGAREQRSWVSVGHPDIRTLTSAPRHCPQKCVFRAGLMVRPFFVREREDDWAHPHFKVVVENRALTGVPRRASARRAETIQT